MSAAPPPSSWSELAAELDCWGLSGRTATLWWRDDDAVTMTPALERLVMLADGVPLALAVIPALAERPLAAWLRASDRAVAILQHGWRHQNHAGTGRKSEFPPGRAVVEVAAELANGRRRLAELTGAAALPVLAPPWNRFDDSFMPLLASAGITALSRLGARAAVTEANVHVDLVAWKGGRGFIGVAAALGGLVGHLRARRLGAADPAEPTGLLTHHLVQDAPTEAFLAQLLRLTRTHPAVRWLAAAEACGVEAATAAA